MTSNDQVARLLSLVPYLQQYGEVDLRETAEFFHVSPRTLLADLRVLMMCGLPGGYPDDLIEVDLDAAEQDQKIRLGNAHFLSRPMRFSVDEAMSLIVALRAVRDIADARVRSAVDSAVSKLAGAAGGAENRVIVTQSGESGTRDLLAQAIVDGRTVQLEYNAAHSPEATRSLVEPCCLTTSDGYTYLQGWSQARQAFRVYRLDRIVSVDITDEPVSDHGTPPAFTDRWLEALPTATRVTLEVAESARWIAEYYPVQSVTTTERGMQVEMLIADPLWLRGLILRLGPAVLAVDPPEAMGPAVQSAKAALAVYRQSGLVD